MHKFTTDIAVDNIILCYLHSAYYFTEGHWTLSRLTMEFSSRKKHIEMSSSLMPLCCVTGKC